MSSSTQVMTNTLIFITLRMVHTECTSTHHYVRYSIQITRHRKQINLFLSLTLGHLNRFSTFPVYLFLCTKAMQKLLPITMKSYLMGMWLAYSIDIKHRGHFVQIFNMDSYSYGLNISPSMCSMLESWLIHYAMIMWIYFYSILVS